ncbi:MAG: ABC transporter ATP-binding protein [Planctomycetes bacterium]|nr:ABC transporter ATP-binding protein [Planctomycetota bacterium]
MIQVRQLTKIYHMGDTVVRALDGVDLSIEAGEMIAVTGQSGSGKSTLMHVLGCLDRPTSGHYELNGRLVDRLSDGQLARIRNREVGFVFQSFNLINRTSALDNVALPLIYGRKSGRRKKAMQALEWVGLADRAKHKPSEMSGGERQRVAIARAIVNDPKILFADEPTGNLDSQTGRQIIEIFHRLHESGTTVILVTHEISVAVQTQRMVHMIDGRIDVDRDVTEEMRRTLLQDALSELTVRGRPSLKRAAS